MAADNQQIPDFSTLNDEDFQKLALPNFIQEEPQQKEETHEEKKEEERQEGDEEQRHKDDEENNENEQLSDEEREARKAEEEEEELRRQEEEEHAEADEKTKAEGKPARERGEDGKFVDKQGERKQTKVESDADDQARLFEPFKANGREMQIRNADEGIRLMQMGANYSRKMEELKPKMGILRTLERNELLDEDKLAFLIDLSKKNPQAIAKLVKDSGFDPLEVDDDKVAAYKPGNYRTSNRELELDNVLESISHGPRYNELVSTIADTWDRTSKDAIGDNPGVMNLLHSHMEGGQYDLIMEELNRQKTLGLLGGTPILRAYDEIGKQMASDGQFDHLQSAKKAPARKVVTPGREKATKERQDLEERRRAAAPGRKTVPAAPKPREVDVWGMSDADFANLKI